jgi:hypothetical protein
MSSLSSSKMDVHQGDRQTQTSKPGEVVASAPITKDSANLSIPLQDIKDQPQAEAGQRKQIPIWRVIVLTIRYVP